MAYEPQAGMMATVNLPGEVTRAEIVKVLGPTVVLVKLAHFTTAKLQHGYSAGDKIACRLKESPLGQVIWEAIPESELNASTRRVEAKVVAPVPLPPVTEEDGFVLGSN